jgi:hypothetical protein
MPPTGRSCFSIAPRNFDSALSPRSELASERVADANERDIRRVLAAQDEGRTDHASSALSYRHDWGSRAGLCHLCLRWDAIDAHSRAFVSVVEGFTGAAGAAKLRLCDVAPATGGIGVRVPSMAMVHPVSLPIIS